MVAILFGNSKDEMFLYFDLTLKQVFAFVLKLKTGWLVDGQIFFVSGRAHVNFRVR